MLCLVEETPCLVEAVADERVPVVVRVVETVPLVFPLFPPTTV